jgi:PAS domain S-box-containing protein
MTEGNDSRSIAGSGTEPAQTPPSILIVEDESIVASDIKETLVSFGYPVKGTKRSGETALEAIALDRPDLVLMDIHLAGKLDGVETAVEIQKRFSIPVIYLTAFADKDLLERARLTGPYGYILKPFEERELHSVIEMAWFKYGMDKKLQESEERLRQLNEELEKRVAERTASLQEQVLFLQQLIDTIPAPVYYKDAMGQYLGCNTAFETYTGIVKRDIIGKPDTSFLPSDMAVLSGAKDQELVSRRGIQVYQAKFPHADHTYRDVIFKKATFKDHAGEIAGIIGVMIDISDRISGEAALKESEERFAAVTEDISEIVYRITPNHTCTFANRAFLTTFKRKAGETVGFVFSPPVHADDAPRLRDYLLSLTREKPVGKITYRVIMPDSTHLNLQWTIRAFFDVDGQVREYQFTGKK